MVDTIVLHQLQLVMDDCVVNSLHTYLVFKYLILWYEFSGFLKNIWLYLKKNCVLAQNYINFYQTLVEYLILNKRCKTLQPN